MIFLFYIYSTISPHVFQNKKRKRKHLYLEVMMNENGVKNDPLEV